MRHSVEDVINYLLTHKHSETSSSFPEEPEPGDSSGQREQHGRSATLVTATLHPTDVSRVLSTAPTPEIRAAWLKGRATSSNTRRLLLKESATEEAVEQGAGQGDDNPFDSHSAVWGKMYAEGREWWRGELD